MGNMYLHVCVIESKCSIPMSIYEILYNRIKKKNLSELSFGSLKLQSGGKLLPHVKK